MSWIRNKYVAALTLVLVIQSTLYYAASRGERVPSSRPLDLFPAQLGIWHEAQNYPVEQEIRDQLKADDLLNRLYTDPESRAGAKSVRRVFQDNPHRPVAALAQELPAGNGVGAGG